MIQVQQHVYKPVKLWIYQTWNYIEFVSPNVIWKFSFVEKIYMEHWAYDFFSSDMLNLETVKCQLFRQVTQTFQLLELLSFKNEQIFFWNSRLTMNILWTTEIRRKLA